jgi:hypothetical protein
MTTIHLEPVWPAPGICILRFIKKGGELFTNGDLAAVREATNGKGFFDGIDRTVIFVSCTQHHGRPEVDAFRTLKQRYPQARFTTYSQRMKKTLGNQIQQIP